MVFIDRALTDPGDEPFPYPRGVQPGKDPVGPPVPSVEIARYRDTLRIRGPQSKIGPLNAVNGH